MGSGLCTMVKKLQRRFRENRSIKLISVDGKVMRFKRRVYVKEIVEKCPEHGIFDAGSVKSLGARLLSSPLDHNSELQQGHLYYLTPLPSAGSRLEELEQNNKSHPEIISTITSIDGSRVLRVKLRMRKEDVVSFLNSNNISFAENFVVNEAPSSARGQPSQTSGSVFTSQWKPSLGTIPELNSHQIQN